MPPLVKQATKVVNAYVEQTDGNWKEVRRLILLDIDFLFREGTHGAKLYAYALDLVFQELAPQKASS